MAIRNAVLGFALTSALASTVCMQPAAAADEHYDAAYGAPHRHVRHGAPYRHGGPYRYVYAESWYGFKRIVAPVRRAEHGNEVRLPGGTWVYCEFSCEYTLRKQSLDLLSENAATKDSSVSPGLFRADIYLDDLGRRRY